jgi:hypothetical protein
VFFGNTVAAIGILRSVPCCTVSNVSTSCNLRSGLRKGMEEMEETEGNALGYIKDDELALL